MPKPTIKRHEYGRVKLFRRKRFSWQLIKEEAYIVPTAAIEFCLAWAARRSG